MTSANNLPDWHEHDPVQEPGTPITERVAARAFGEVFGDRLAYCHDHGKWFEYDGNTWRICRMPVAFNYAAELIDKIGRDSPSGPAMQKARFCASVETYAKASPVFRRGAEYWDRDPMLLGTPGGTVDLRTGKLRPSMQSDCITKSTAVPPDVFEDCPAWHNFLDQATAGDEGMQRYLQQICGYSLTGLTSEQALFFIYGGGGNGKGVFINTVQQVMGEYAKTAAMETFAARKGSSHPTELAMLRGARMVTASETEEGAAWAEARIKQLTGGDLITARFMRQDFFEFMPQFTLIIVGNHKPALRTVDDAMRRRFNIIPFTIKPKKPDPKLTEKLKDEWPAILRWMINGALDWQINGLVRPQSVVDATAEYFDDQNSFQQWIDQECSVDLDNPHCYERAPVLFESWVRFAKAQAVEVGDIKSFKPAMIRAGFDHKRYNYGRFFIGIRLKSSPDSENPTR